MYALIVSGQFFVAHIGSRSQFPRQEFHQRREFVVNRGLVGTLRVWIAYRRAPHRAARDILAPERLFFERDPLRKKVIAIAEISDGREEVSISIRESRHT